MTYDNFAKTFSNSRKNMKWGELDYFMELISNTDVQLNTGVKVLDIGCGNGRLLNSLIPVLKDFEYLGIDSSAGMIEEAKTLYPMQNFQLLDMLDLDKLNEKFDIIFFIASFHHLESEGKRLETLAKLKNILAKNGIIFFTNWTLLSSENITKYTENPVGSGDFQIKIGEFSRYYHGFKIEELENLFQKSGFRIIENRIFENGRNIISILQ